MSPGGSGAVSRGLADTLKRLDALNIAETMASSSSADSRQASSELLQGLQPGLGLFGSKEQEAPWGKVFDAETAAMQARNQAAKEAGEKQVKEAAKAKAQQAGDDMAASMPTGGESGPALQVYRAPAKNADEEELGDLERDIVTFKLGPDFVFAGTEVFASWEYFAGPGWQRKIDELYSQVAMTKPEGMIENPHSWQLKGAMQADFCCESTFSGFLCGDGPGLGKTLLAVLAMWLRKDEPGMSLVIAPKTVCQQWYDTIERAFQPGHELRAYMLDDSKVSGHDLVAGGYDIIIVSYEFCEANLRPAQSLPSKIDAFKKADFAGMKPVRPTCALAPEFWKSIGLPFKRVVLDEVQKVNKHDSVRHRAIKKLYCRAFICLSGTMAHNKWHDLAGVLDFLGGHPFETRGKFMRTFAARDFGGDITELLDGPRMRLLQRFLQACLIARPSDVLQLPDLERLTVTFHLKTYEEQSIADVMQEFRKMAAMNQNNDIDDKEAFGLLTKCALINGHPIIIEDYEENAKQKKSSDNTESIDFSDDPDAVYGAQEKREQGEKRLEWLNKVNLRENLCEVSGRLICFLRLYNYCRSRYPDEKIVVFSMYLKFLDVIAEALRREHNVEALRYDGTTTTAHREKVREAFNRCDASVPLLITGGAGSVGLNITAASIVIQTEPWWNANSEVQALCRVWRQLQEKEVKAFRMEAVNSEIDDFILATQVRKQHTISDLMKPLIRSESEGPAVVELLSFEELDPLLTADEETEDEEMEDEDMEDDEVAGAVSMEGSCDEGEDI